MGMKAPNIQRPRAAIGAATVLALAALFTLPGARAKPADDAAEWTRWRGPLGSGLYPAETGWTTDWPGKGPRKLWRVEVGVGYSGIAVSEGRAYTVGNLKDKDVVYALDGETGKILWTTRYAQDRVSVYNPGGPNASPAVDGSWVYVLGKQGLLHCLDKKKGRIRWRVDLARKAKAKMPTWGFASTPLILGDSLYLNINESGIALDKNTGEIQWNSKPDDCGYAAPVPMTFRGEPALAIFGTRALFIVHRTDGRKLWKVDWPTKMGENSADPIPVDGNLYVSSWWGMGAALFDPRRDDRKPLWRNKEFQNHIAAPVLFEGNFYGFDGPVHRRRNVGTLRCVNAKTGKTAWSESGLKGSLLVANGKLLILSNDGRVIVADATPEGYRERAKWSGFGRRTWSPPVLHHGRLYIRDADGWATCLDLNPKKKGP